jgi:predicted O-methyltransferase YrrM
LGDWSDGLNRARRGGRWFDYDRRLLPNPHLAKREPDQLDPEVERLGSILALDHDDFHAALNVWMKGSQYSMGYPAWNLLYYALFCSLEPDREDVVVIETGTHRGLSTIVMAQALKDLGVNAKLDTVELGPIEDAKAAVAQAGLTDFVSFHQADSLEFLSDLAGRVEHIDFAFIDDHHTYEHVAQEIDLVCPKVAARGGTMYFDNTSSGGVAEALGYLHEEYGGNLVEFTNCSWMPAGNAIWQADRPRSGHAT